VVVDGAGGAVEDDVDVVVELDEDDVELDDDVEVVVG